MSGHSSKNLKQHEPIGLCIVHKVDGDELRLIIING